MIDPTLPAGAPPTAPTDDTLPPRYQAEHTLALGGQGQVILAHDTRLDRDVAVKVLFAGGASDEVTRAQREIQIMSRLQHRGIVAIYDAGELADGRLWYAMRRVRGQELHVWAQPLRAPNGALRVDRLRPVVEVVEQICRTVGYAHDEGVVHRDLKPANVMVEGTNVVQVLDWGISCSIGERISGVATPLRFAQDRAITQTNVALGTPHYMAPEQLVAGQEVRPTADVYAIGVMLYTLLAGRRPYGERTPEAVLRALPLTPPPALSDVLAAADRDLIDLMSIAERAMARRAADRHRDCTVLADDLAQWLRAFGERRAADEIVAGSEAVQRRLDVIIAERAAVQARADAILNAVAVHAPVSEKSPGWALEDEASALDARVRELRLSVEQQLHVALSRDRTHPQAHRLLAQLYRDRAEAAETERQLSLADEFAARVALHDRGGEHRAWSDGRGSLTIHTTPAGARVTLHRVKTVERRLQVQRRGLDLGRTPLDAVSLERGAWVAHLHIEDQPPVRYPVWIGRGTHWIDRAPGGAVVPVDLTAAALPAELDGCFVPAGWFRSGGDPLAADGLPGRRCWTDAFVMERFPVTHRRYLEFINALAKTDLTAARRYRPPPKRDDVHGRTQYAEAEGVFSLTPDTMLRLDAPVMRVDWHSAQAFARWRAETTGEPWRLPHSLEWEKAGRGVSGRLFPWGDAPEPTFANTLKGSSEAPGVTAVTSHPTDVSVYGVRGMAGNVREWCGDAYTRDGGDVQPGPATTFAEYRCVRGGSFSSMMPFCRLATRFALAEGDRMIGLGFRLARDA